MMISENFIQAMRCLLHFLRQRRLQLGSLVISLAISPVVLAGGHGVVQAGHHTTHMQLRAPNYAHGHLRSARHHSYYRGALGVAGGLVGAGVVYSTLQPHWDGGYGSRSVRVLPTVIHQSPVIRYVAAEPVVQTVIAPITTIIRLREEPSSAVPVAQAVAGPAESAADGWYVCERPAGYYPQIQVCPGGWQKQAAH